MICFVVFSFDYRRSVSGKGVKSTGTRKNSVSRSLYIRSEAPNSLFYLFLSQVSLTFGVAYRSVDYNEAMTYKGVITYIDSKDIPGDKFITDDELLFATEKV